jgi:hypothetical protein
MFSQIAPAVLRIGGNSVDTTCWGGVSNTTPITAAQVTAFAGFVKALPANWHVIYGINMSVNSPTNCAAEAAYAANALGSSLLGFEIGNEPDLYHNNGIRPANFTYPQYLSQWQALAAAVTNAVPGWAITNGGNGWTLTGPAAAGNTEGYTAPFAGNEAGVASMVTQHYYRANGQSPSSTMALLLQPDTSLPGAVSNIVAAATAARLPLGFRMAECGSFYNGGAVINANGSWAGGAQPVTFNQRPGDRHRAAHQRGVIDPGGADGDQYAGERVRQSFELELAVQLHRLAAAIEFGGPGGHQGLVPRAGFLRHQQRANLDQPERGECVLPDGPSVMRHATRLLISLPPATPAWPECHPTPLPPKSHSRPAQPRIPSGPCPNNAIAPPAPGCPRAPSV